MFWNKSDNRKWQLIETAPTNEIVELACDTYDCGWTMDTVWWCEDKQCWMTTGGVKSMVAHLPYSHWRKLPPFPNEV